jgi:hypothetical protein
MKNTDNLFTRYFLKSLTEAVAADPVADVEAGGADVDALKTAPVEGDDPAVAGAEGDAAALAGNETLVNNMVAGIEKAGQNAKELQTLSDNLEKLKSQMAAMLQNPATREYAEKINSAIEDGQKKIQDKLTKFSDAVTDMNGDGNQKKPLFGVMPPAAGAAPAPAPAPAEGGEPPAEPAPEDGAPPA